ncbi:MAG: AMP-binding protein, partial [Clostridia bacterium]|nr:AMP-binding protein [Clostridia bacterium]
MLEKFLDKTEYGSYEELKAGYSVRVPEGFNFAYDVVDAWTKEQPGKNALYYCDDSGARRMYTFEEVSELSKKEASWLLSLGVKRGDRVMFMLKQAPEVWFTFIACHRIGAVCIPATFQLTPKDIVYRCNAASVRLICVTDDAEMLDYVREALPKCPTVYNVAVCGNNIPEPFLDMRAGIAAAQPFEERVHTA